MIFRDRVDAGQRLSFLLRRYRDEAPLVIGLVRGGVVVAHEVARALAAPLDAWVVRKIGVPGHEELGLGAVAEGDEPYLDEELMAEVGLSFEAIADVVDQKVAEVQQRVRRLRHGRPPPDLLGRTAIVVDDGIATGGTMRAVLRALRRRRPKRLVLAVPVAAKSTLASLRNEADDVICLDADPDLISVGAYYEDFHPISDAEVLGLLKSADHGRSSAGDEEAPRSLGAPGEPAGVELEAEGVRLPASLAVPAGATGLVLFAHGSGSGRLSPRNQFVAAVLRRAGLATLLFDLLTKDEATEDEETGRLRFDVHFLARRVLGAALWARAQPETRALALGYFGASTGAAAALIAAARRPDLVAGVVSRGGRPDLAGPCLEEVVTPTLLIVGSADAEVLALNQEALRLLQGPRELAVVPRATHLFEEPGALQEVARIASSWFARHLGAKALDETA